MDYGGCISRAVMCFASPSGRSGHPSGVNYVQIYLKGWTNLDNVSSYRPRRNARVRASP